MSRVTSSLTQSYVETLVAAVLQGVVDAARIERFECDGRGLSENFSMLGGSTPAGSMCSSHRCMICSVGGSDLMVSEIQVR